MTTLITYQNSEETRRCDAHCYDAKHDKCDCICGGRNHGVGLRKAADQVAEIAGELQRRVDQNEIQTYDWWRITVTQVVNLPLL